MNKIFDGSRKISAIIEMLPEATGIFYKYNLDYQKYLDKTLSNFVNDTEIELEHIMTELNEIISEYAADGTRPYNYNDDSLKDLIKHIMTRHSSARKILKEADGLILKALQEHYNEHGKELTKVYKTFGRIKIEIELHLIKEESVMFTLMSDYESDKDEKIITKIKQVEDEVKEEHEGVCGLFNKLRIATNYYKEPENASMSYQRAYYLLKKLERDLFEHIIIENTILFKKFN